MQISSHLKALKKTQSYRQRKTVESIKSTQIVIDNKTLINFCSNDYLSLKNHPEVIASFKKGADKYGVGSGASHLISGHSKAHQELEEKIANLTNQPRALLFSTGYMANLGVFSALKDHLDWCLEDKLNHASLIDAAHLIGLPMRRYLHNDMANLEQKSVKQKGAGIIATDRVFSMDGDLANLDAISKIAKKSGAIMLQDDAHGFGIFDFDIPANSIYMATLGKSAGVMGAFVASNADLIELLIQKSRPYIYTTALAPALCCATLKSIELIQKGEQKTQLLENIKYFKKLAAEVNLPIKPSKSAIQPLILGSSENALKVSKALYDAGFFVSAIRPPTVPKNTARLRITLNTDHTFAEIKSLVQKITDAL